MSIEFWFLYELLPIAAMVLVPLGVLLHFWRAADARPLPADAAGAAVPRVWPDPARAQLRRARVASAIVAVVVLARILRIGVTQPYEPEWHGLLAALLTVFLCTAVLLLRPAALGRDRTPQQPTDVAASGGVHSPARFGARWWFVAWGACLAALAAAVVWAGLISEPDENGNYTMHLLRIGETSGGTSIAGWYQGVPILISAGLLAALVLLALRLQAGRRLAVDESQDAWLRRAATRTLLTLSAGAVVVTLAWVLGSIGSAAQIGLSAPSPETGEMVSLASPLAPIGPPIRALGMLLEGVGIALLMLPLFSRLAPLAQAAAAQAPTLEHDEPRAATS